MKEINLFKAVGIYIMAIVALAFSMSAYADDLPPEYLKDAVITVTLKSGEVYTFSANTHKVVRRGVKAELRDEMLLPGEPARTHVSAKWSSLLFVAHGPTDMVHTKNPQPGQAHSVRQEKGLVLGLGLTRRINDRFKLGGMVQTNETFGLLLQGELD
jgi:hypothetical protein